MRPFVQAFPNREMHEPPAETGKEAYEILKDTEKRKLYDRFGMAAFDGSMDAGAYQSSDQMNANYSTYEDLFRSFFDGGDSGAQIIEFGGKAETEGISAGSINKMFTLHLESPLLNELLDSIFIAAYNQNKTARENMGFAAGSAAQIGVFSFFVDIISRRFAYGKKQRKVHIQP